ncbi:hypothetical protein Pmar_PMAR002083 [Perkinsus marinus ATCC 50983]|uniref:Uncharacterized protein n=1 Tax=Perkinsus marinus (strain ATCC 50983 / TXsc) TaxID=423536 RepID=C5LYM5_PERM5|nr:hypothetical protein Pmar_PMAR002083 [Perkinsus marinus ATCC 50983]EEQ98263.1 hypothetical protein Pmar_PMAR002083 [Perkinsus marinus ATCC 50983]|eukprot:XP_002765546.1 hypothetical protein Pmar_PMAR002083 [Perkinsus marinus ATCC 50983]
MTERQATVIRILVDPAAAASSEFGGRVLLTGEACIRLATDEHSNIKAHDELVGDSVILSRGGVELIRPDEKISPSPSEFFSDGSEQEFDLLVDNSGSSSSRGSATDVNYVTIDRNTGYVQARKNIFSPVVCEGQPRTSPEVVERVLAESGEMGRLWLLSFSEANHARVCAELRRIFGVSGAVPIAEMAFLGTISNLLTGTRVTHDVFELIFAKVEARRVISPMLAERIFKMATKESWYTVVALVAPLLGRELDESEQMAILSSVQEADDLELLTLSLPMSPEIQCECAEKLLGGIKGEPSAKLIGRVCEGNMTSCSLLLETHTRLVTPCLKDVVRQGTVAIPTKLGRTVYMMGLKNHSAAIELCRVSGSLLNEVLKIIYVERKVEVRNAGMGGMLTASRSGDLLMAIVTDCLPELSDQLLDRTDISATVVSMMSDLVEPLDIVHDVNLKRCLEASIDLCSEQLAHWRALSRASHPAAAAAAQEGRRSVPVLLAEAGLADLAILFLKSGPVRRSSVEGALNTINCLFTELPPAAVFALQQESLPKEVESLAGDAIRRYPKAIVEHGDPNVLVLAVDASVKRKLQGALQSLLREMPSRVKELLETSSDRTDAVRMMCEAVLCDPTPHLVGMLRKMGESSEDFGKTIRVCEMQPGLKPV